MQMLNAFCQRVDLQERMSEMMQDRMPKRMHNSLCVITLDAE